MSGIYLASKSPRRNEILKSLKVEFEVLNYRHEESAPFENESAYDFVERNTKEKSLSAFAHLQENQKKILPVLTADTIVSIGDKILGKPENKDHAISMLLELSGQSHEVISCVSLGILDDSESDTVNFNMNIVETKVFMKTLTAYECSKYWDTREPLDKAGSYGIQGIGATFIEKIVGSHSNVVGLPIFETCKILDDLKINYWLSK